MPKSWQDRVRGGNVLGEEGGKVSLKPGLSRKQKDVDKAHAPYWGAGEEGLLA